jgi:hypothetical protein
MFPTGHRSGKARRGADNFFYLIEDLVVQRSATCFRDEFEAARNYVS